MAIAVCVFGGMVLALLDVVCSVTTFYEAVTTMKARSILTAASLVLVGSFPASAGILSDVRVAGASSTQAVITYSVAGSAACTVEVSESATLRPLVHDVNPVLFPGADIDSREGTTTAGNVRTFIVGRHGMSYRGATNPFLAADAKVYSRALQAYTLHYYRLTCGGEIASGSFQTANIPVGKTFSEPVPTAGPGRYNFPTLSADRSQTIIDPNTGALIRRISLAGDHADRVLPTWYSGGFHDWCSPILSNGGYHCLVPGTGGNQSALYWISPLSGEVRFLGQTSYTGASGDDGYRYLFLYGDKNMWDWSDANVAYLVDMGRYVDPAKGFTHSVIVKWTYTGKDVAVAQGAAAPSVTTNLTRHSVEGTLNEQLAAYSPAFAGQRQLFTSIGGISTQGRYLLLEAKRYQQNSYVWFFAYDLSARRVVAATPEWTHPRTRWCGNHSAAPAGNQPILHWEVQTLGGGSSTGPWGTSLLGAIGTGETTIRVAGEPACTNSSVSACFGLSGGSDAGNGATHTRLMDAAVGDWIQIGSELLEITGKPGPGTWSVARGKSSRVSAHAANAPVTMYCNAEGNAEGNWGEPFWAFLEDPMGTDLSNTKYVVDKTMSGSHYVTRGAFRIMAGWDAVQGALPAAFGAPITMNVQKSPSFAGRVATADGNSFQSHPSYHNADAGTGAARTWFLDQLPFIGGNLHSANPGAVLVAGSLYRYSPSGAYPLFPTTFGTFGASLQTPLVDVSGPASRLTGDAVDANKYCLARRAGECYAGSQAGEAYVNVPGLALAYCAAGSQNLSQRDVCLGNVPAYGQAVVQIGLVAANLVAQKPYPVYGAGRSRVVTNALSAYRALSDYANAKALPDGSWAGFPAARGGDATNNYGTDILLVRLPPVPTAADSHDYSDYLSSRVSIPDASATVPGLATAAVEFGYAENGRPADFYCTQRQEGCTKGNEPGNEFHFASDNAPGLSCAHGCSIALPLVPGRIAFYRIHYRNAANQDLAVGPLQVAIPPGIGAPEPPVNIRVIK